MELEKEFVERMNNILGDSSKDFFLSLEKPSQKGITINTTRISINNCLENCDFNAKPIENTTHGYYVDNFKIGKHFLNHAGIIYSQEPSAMYPVEMLGIEENDLVLDLCASPGGKSIQILEKLNNTGLLISNEIVYNRAKILYENLSRMGFKNFAITCNSPKDYEDSNIVFDKIIVDAPCGGEGMFRKDTFDFNVYSSTNIPTNAKRQLSILNSIKDRLKNGGRLVYSTCTYAIEENEQVVYNFLQENPEFHLIHLDQFDSSTSKGIKINNSNTDWTYRRYPHIHRGEGQFIAVLEKCNGDYNKTENKFYAQGFQELNKKEYQIIEQNLKNVANIKNLNFTKRNDIYYVLPYKTVNFQNLNLVTIGCVLGTINKNILKIDHNFYHTYGDLFTSKFEINKEYLQKYLRGEEITYTGNNSGIVVITYLNIPIGGGKIVGDRIKNYYPKELRN